ncbi:hypothetical protein BDV96DRAFT_651611 [Lophiotrema nucula]|uniref:Uncharacterized protein n=1 Tax=Lophiotrema nucula TaxID=690887 RepID=A0A6A5YRH5_9PLEO|nr:hypothetical protein BDV96DRAFT_651611 [Lophiotrema nucula]
MNACPSNAPQEPCRKDGPPNKRAHDEDPSDLPPQKLAKSVTLRDLFTQTPEEIRQELFEHADFDLCKFLTTCSSTLYESVSNRVFRCLSIVVRDVTGPNSRLPELTERSKRRINTFTKELSMSVSDKQEDLNYALDVITEVDDKKIKAIRFPRGSFAGTAILHRLGQVFLNQKMFRHVQFPLFSPSTLDKKRNVNRKNKEYKLGNPPYLSQYAAVLTLQLGKGGSRKIVIEIGSTTFNGTRMHDVRTLLKTLGQEVHVIGLSLEFRYNHEGNRSIALFLEELNLDSATAFQITDLRLVNIDFRAEEMNVDELKLLDLSLLEKLEVTDCRHVAYLTQHLMEKKIALKEFSLRTFSVNYSADDGQWLINFLKCFSGLVDLSVQLLDFGNISFLELLRTHTDTIRSARFRIGAENPEDAGFQSLTALCPNLETLGFQFTPLTSALTFGPSQLSNTEFNLPLTKLAGEMAKLPALKSIELYAPFHNEFEEIHRYPPSDFMKYFDRRTSTIEHEKITVQCIDDVIQGCDVSTVQSITLMEYYQIYLNTSLHVDTDVEYRTFLLSEQRKGERVWSKVTERK